MTTRREFSPPRAAAERAGPPRLTSYFSDEVSEEEVHDVRGLLFTTAGLGAVVGMLLISLAYIVHRFRAPLRGRRASAASLLRPALTKYRDTSGEMCYATLLDLPVAKAGLVLSDPSHR